MKRFLAAILILWAGASSHAAEITADFEGYVSWLTSPGSGLLLGDPIYGRLRYDSAVPADSIDVEQAQYSSSLQELTLNMLHDGAVVQTFSARGGTITVVNSSSAYYFYAYGTVGLEDDSWFAEPLESLALILQNDNAVPGASTTLPQQLSMANFNPAISFINVNVNDNTELEAAITSISVVPEPSGEFLAAIGGVVVLAIALRGRRLSEATVRRHR